MYWIVTILLFAAIAFVFYRIGKLDGRIEASEEIGEHVDKLHEQLLDYKMNSRAAYATQPKRKPGRPKGSKNKAK